MKIEKDKRKVGIMCKDGSVVTGTVHINPGERMLDFINDPKESFIPVTDAEVCYPEGTPEELKMICKKKNTIILNKSEIKLIEEL